MISFSSHLFGALVALIASLMIAVQYVFVRLGTQNGRISDLMYISLLCNVVITVPPALVWFDVSMSLEAVAFFAAAGLAGSLFGRICIFTSVNLIGANRTSPVVSGNALFATILAVVVLGETLTALHFVGVVMIVVGIVIVSYETAENTSKDYSRRRFAVLMAIPLLAALFISFEPIFISLGLENGGSVVPGIAIMVTAAWIGYTLYLVFDDDLPSRSLVREPYAKWYVGAGVATTIGFVAYFAAIELAPVAVVVPLIQTTPLLTVALTAIFLPRRLERVTVSIVVAATVVVVGATIVTLSG